MATARHDRAKELLGQFDVSAPSQTRPRRVVEPEAIPPEETQEPTPARAPATETQYWDPILAMVRERGFTHPSWGGWLQLPHEFDAILAKEDKAVAQVVLAIMRKTLGWVDPRGGTDSHGSPKRIEWAHIDSKHFKAICGGSSSQANRGIQAALELRYIERERIKIALQRGLVTRDDVWNSVQGGGFVYRIRWTPAKPA